MPRMKTVEPYPCKGARKGRGKNPSSLGACAYRVRQGKVQVFADYSRGAKRWIRAEAGRWMPKPRCSRRNARRGKEAGVRGRHGGLSLGSLLIHQGRWTTLRSCLHRHALTPIEVADVGPR